MPPPTFNGAEMRIGRPLSLAAGIVVIAAVGTGIYQERQLAVRREQLQRLGQKRTALTEQIRQLACQRDEATNLLAVLNWENARLRSGQMLTELLRLRGQVGVLRQELMTVGPGTFLALPALVATDPAVKAQVRERFRRSVQLNSGALFEELKLTHREADDVLQAYADAELKRLETFAAVPPGTRGQQELTQIEDDARADFYRHLQSLLGETSAGRIKDAFEEAPALFTIDLLNLQLGANQLTEEQAKRLVRVVKAEPFRLTEGVVPGWDTVFWGMPQDVQDHVAKIEQSNQRILQNANSFLNPEQLSALSAVLSNAVNARIAYAAAYIQKQ